MTRSNFGTWLSHVTCNSIPTVVTWLQKVYKYSALNMSNAWINRTHNDRWRKTRSHEYYHSLFSQLFFYICFIYIYIYIYKLFLLFNKRKVNEVTQPFTSFLKRTTKSETHVEHNYMKYKPKIPHSNSFTNPFFIYIYIYIYIYIIFGAVYW